MYVSQFVIVISFLNLLKDVQSDDLYDEYAALCLFYCDTKGLV